MLIEFKMRICNTGKILERMGTEIGACLVWLAAMIVQSNDMNTKESAANHGACRDRLQIFGWLQIELFLE